MPHSNKQMISFFLTTKCNLRCTYCYNNNERNEFEHKTLSIQIAKAGIDDYFEKHKSRHIRFYGPGEPTLEFDLMRQITEYAKQKGGKNISVELQTNGAFSKNIRQWILKNIDIVWVSFDGPPDIQNKQRPFPKNKPSAPKIEENIKWLIKSSTKSSFMVGARVTMTNLNIKRQVEMVEYFNCLGINHVWTDPEFPAVDKIPVCDDKEKLSTFQFDMDLYLEKFIEAHQYAQRLNMFYGSFLTCNFDGETKTHCRACTPVPHLTPDGYVSACDLVVLGSNSHHMNCFIYGKWNEKTKQFDYDVDKIDILRNRNVDNLKHCEKCIAKMYCGGYCLGEVVNETGNLFGQKKVACTAIRTLFTKLGSFERYNYLHP